MTTADHHEGDDMPHITTGEQAIARAERRAQAVQLRAQGLTLRQIAERLQVAPSTVHEDVQQALRDVPAEDVEQLRTIWGERLDTAVHLVMDRISAGDLSAVDKLVALTNRAARLYGLDAPQQVTMTGGTDVDIDRAVRDLVAAAQEQPADFPPQSWHEDNGGQQS